MPEAVFELVLVLIAVPAVIFLAFYSIIFRWWSSWAGRLLVLSSLGSLLLALISLIITEDIPTVMLAPLTLFAVSEWAKFYLLRESLDKAGL